MRKIHLLSFVCIISIVSCKSDDTISEEISNPETSQPNILLIIADDMGLDATPGFSEGIIKPNMPNLESFIANGVRFNNLWSAPTCSPTRATILTGKYGVQTGVLAVGDEISTAETSLQSYLNDNTSDAYSHAIIGKWHLSNDPMSPSNMGIDYYAGVLGGGVQSYWNWNLTENGVNTTSTTYTTTKFTDLAIDWVDAQEKPWFLWLAFNAPHTPFHLPPTALHSQGDLPTDQASIDANPTPYYMAAIEAMDSEIGRLLSSFSEEERANTVIIFIGDNGTPNQVAQSPYNSNRVKGSLYQGGVNVPMIVSGYGVDRSNQVEQGMINTTDLFATIADIANSGTTSVHNSVSFKPLLVDTSAEKRAFIYSEIDGQNNNGYAIRNETYKLIVFNDRTERMYHLIEDPYESTNLLNGTLSNTESIAKSDLEQKALEIRQ
ncbi:sulfatase-like hydrolase/transferase [Aquimarina sp. 2201CG14-23]|uniref:sulfatase-like hydrolase/transferase n=1 Tax=Aquimarina mycalae TaxID=3040073 RepID=UPI002477FEAB|nr:sulfatase-like hydrolase/transferase [Aquimarina sp. 2201CG14-23]MDH7447781.1 sulfatase-like hydrolase/transferase [Aquimarina sp. 2201CG14-23]